MSGAWRNISRWVKGTPMWLRTAAAVLAFALAIALAGYRTASLLNIPGQPKDESRWALGDFRDAVYYPVVAFLHGDNPYDPAYADAYPVYGVLPPYSPFTLIVHAPLGLLPYEIAEWTYFGLSAALVVLLAWVSLRVCGVAASADRVMGLAALIAFSRAAHTDLVLGQVSLQLVVAALAALHFAQRRPWLAGLALGIVSLKATFVIPLAWLMLCRGDYRAVAIGVMVGGLGALAAVLIICGGVGELPGFFETFLASYQKVEQGASFDPTIAWSRVDAMTVISRLPGVGASRLTAGIVTLLGLLLAGIALVWRRKPAAEGSRALDRGALMNGADDWSGVFTCVVTLLACYHMVYDALLLVAPVTAVCVARRPVWRSLKLPMRLGLIAALGLPLVNYASSKTALSLLSSGAVVSDGAVRSLLACSSAIALLAACGLLLSIPSGQGPPAEPDERAHPRRRREHSTAAA